MGGSSEHSTEFLGSTECQKFPDCPKPTSFSTKTSIPSSQPFVCLLPFSDSGTLFIRITVPNYYINVCGCVCVLPLKCIILSFYRIHWAFQSVLNKEKNEYFTEQLVTYSIQQTDSSYTFEWGMIQPLYQAISQNDLDPIWVQNENPFITLTNYFIQY